MTELIKRLSEEAKVMAENYAIHHNITKEDAYDVIFSQLVATECIRSFYNQKSELVTSNIKDAEVVDISFNFARKEISKLFLNNETNT